MELEIVIYTAAYEPKVRAFLQENVEEECLAGPLFDPAEFEAPGAFWLWVDGNNQVRGTVGLSQDGEVKRYCMHREFRDRGFGQTLLNEALTQAERSGIVARLRTRPAKAHAAVHIFHKVGFVRLLSFANGKILMEKSIERRTPGSSP